MRNVVVNLDHIKDQVSFERLKDISKIEFKESNLMHNKDNDNLINVMRNAVLNGDLIGFNFLYERHVLGLTFYEIMKESELSYERKRQIYIDAKRNNRILKLKHFSDYSESPIDLSAYGFSTKIAKIMYCLGVTKLKQLESIPIEYVSYHYCIGKKTVDEYLKVMRKRRLCAPSLNISRDKYPNKDTYNKAIMRELEAMYPHTKFSISDTYFRITSRDGVLN